jgi:hypothetical protein
MGSGTINALVSWFELAPAARRGPSCDAALTGVIARNSLLQWDGMHYSVVDGSIIDDQGRVVFYSADRCMKEIVDEDRCFICGRLRIGTVFNDEHVIPDWLLRRHSLHDKRIVIPGESDLQYGRYKIPCCRDCNSLSAIRR